VPQDSNTALNQIFWNGGAPLNPNGVQGITASPTVKTITITNTTDQTIYPILRDANTGQDPHNTNMSNPSNYYDPQDFHNQEYRAYIGYIQNGIQYLGLPAHATITIRVPLVFWDAENTYIATDGKDLIPANPATNSNPFRYDPTSTRGVSISTDANSWVTASTINKVPYTGLVMFYHDTTPLTPALDSPAQLTEFTIRDQYLNTGGAAPGKGWLTDSAQTIVLFNYDVSYVDNLTSPIAMEATQVPIPIALDPAPPVEDFGWAGSSLIYGTPQQTGTMQNLIDDFINNTGLANIGNYFGGAGWPSYINPNGILKIPGGANIFGNSPLNGQLSSYFTYGPNNQWMLTSGGTAPIMVTAGGTVSSPSQTVLPLIFISKDQQTTFFAKLQQMLNGNQEVDLQIAPIPSPVLGKVVSFSDSDTNPTVTVVLSSNLPVGPVSYVFSRPATDYAATDITNLWYSWAQYYVNQFQGFVPPSGITGTIAAKTNILTLDSPVPSTLAVGMTVSGSGIVPAPGTTVTILGFNPNNNKQIYLSQLSAGGGSGTFTFGAPQALPFANSDGIKSISVANGGSGYSVTSPPTVSITGGGGSGATAVAVVVAGQVTNVVITNAGSGYTSAPTISFSGGGGSGAVATATVGTFVTPFALSFTKDQQQTALNFSGSVYEAMAAEAAIPGYTVKNPKLPPPMSLVYTTIGTDVQDLPNSNGGGSLVGTQVTNLIKSILRGVYDFTQIPEAQWYPNPSTWQGGQHFNVYNLDPYVWFVHRVLGLSGYGFSVDDDTSDVSATASPYTPMDQQVKPYNLQIVFSGLGDLNNPNEWFPSVNYGTVTDEGTISNPDSGPYAGETIVTLTNTEKYWQIMNPGPALIGAYVSGPGIIPGTVVAAQGDVKSLILILSNHAPSASNVPLTFSGTPPANPILDSGFETPILTESPPANFISNPTGTPWTFNQSSGIAGNGSSFTALNGPAPEGTQVAFLQNQGMVSQRATLQAGTYILSFDAAQRQLGQTIDNQTIAILVDGNEVGEITPSGANYTTYNVSFTVATGTHTITIESVGGSDATALIDAVTLTAKQRSTITQTPPAPTATTASSATPTFSDGTQGVTLTAQVTSGAGAVNEGSVTFTVLQGSTVIGSAVTSTTVRNGQASVSYALPAGTAAGAYTLVAVYNPGADFAGSEDTTHALTVAPAAAAIQFTRVTVIPNLFAGNQTETIAVHVSGPGGVVNAGTVMFTVDGQSMSASVDGNGNATVSLTLPLLTVASPQNISAAFSGPNRSPTTATQTSFLGLVEALLPEVDSFAADGSQSVQSFLLGLPLLDFLYTSQGQLTKVVFGSHLLSWDFSYSGVLTVVRLDGVLPVMVAVWTPQGQFLGAMALTVSADGTPMVESISAQGQVISSQPM
jgi:hypothetical protein